jgi:predicted RNA-binding protein (virulence factor B family)
MILVGRYQTLPVWRWSRFGAFLGEEADHVLLPKGEAPPQLEVGEQIRVFVYADSEDRPVATLRTPKAAVGEFVCLQVVDVTPIGAFMDWGLEKDLLVPINRQHHQMRRGEWHVVYVYLDEKTERPVGSSKVVPHLDADVSRYAPQQQVEILVFDVTDMGARVIVDGRHGGMIHPVPGELKPRIGDKGKAWVQRVRPDRLDIRTKPLGAKGRFDEKVELITALMAADGFLPLHDRSPPEQIRDQLGMSKKAFKRALGGLYKSGKVEPVDGGIRLVSSDE